MNKCRLGNLPFDRLRTNGPSEPSFVVDSLCHDPGHGTLLEVELWFDVVGDFVVDLEAVTLGVGDDQP